MGVTVHWIDENFKRNSAVLTLSRFVGSHTNDKIADLLIKCFNFYQISRKIVLVITDNASNFIKAFREYGLQETSEEDRESALEETNEGEPESEHDLETIDDVFSKFDEEEFAELPPHYRCASHSLSLVATTDFKAALISGFGGEKQATKFKKTMRDAMSKCTAFWNKVGRSVQTAEAVKSIFKQCVVTPSATRWNSTFDSVEFLLKKKDLLDEAFILAKIPKLNEAERELLKEYQAAMAPIAWSLDKMQSEANIYFGFIAPILFKCETKLTGLCNGDSLYGKYIAKSLLVGLRKRFGGILNFDRGTAHKKLVAAICLPSFKLWWVPEDKKIELKDLFMREAKSWNEKEVDTNPGMEFNNANQDDDLFDFDLSRSSGNSTGINDAEQQCVQYLQDSDTSIQSLRKYPIIMSMSVKFNTALPSSAPAERLFSYGGMILRPQRARMSDENFEKLVFLKLNSFRK
ncbi:unnamed protein product [Orchesella dallaii]|uniref:HAT C-terminal dimerisation domain-containing protein n=1 Tax=Orchesella dallaii TaxID=48710 RepID=A0ABP1R676_9HEXA